MLYSVLDPEGKIQGRVESDSIRAACRAWAQQTMNEAVVEAAVQKAHVFSFGSEQAARLEPYLVSPSGREREAQEANQKLLDHDPLYQPGPTGVVD